MSDQKPVIVIGGQWQGKFIAVLLVLLVAVCAGGAYLYKQNADLSKEAVDKATTIGELKKAATGYEREIAALETAADDLAQQLRTAPTRTVVKWRTKTVYVPGQPGKTDVVTVPADCIECFKKHDMPYHFDNEYVSLDDVLMLDLDTNTLKSAPGYPEFNITDKFKLELVRAGVKGFMKYDEKFWQWRWQVGVDAGVQSLAYKQEVGLDASHIALTAGAEFLNLKKLLKVPIGMDVQLGVPPASVENTHIMLGLQYRPMRNVALGLAYGRSLTDNFAVFTVSLFPTD